MQVVSFTLFMFDRYIRVQSRLTYWKAPDVVGVLISYFGDIRQCILRCRRTRRVRIETTLEGCRPREPPAAPHRGKGDIRTRYICN